MSWVRIDDGFANHPKVEPLSDKAFRLFVCGLCFAGRNLTDGALSTKAVKVVQIEAGATRKHVDELHHAGLWDRTGDGFLIHDYLDRNLSRTEVETIRAKRQEAGRKGGLASGETRRKAATLTPAERRKRQAAAARANTALKAGRIQMEPCEVCGSYENLEMHHDDYDLPEQVRWLCREHHNGHHSEATAQANGSKHLLKHQGSTPSRPPSKSKASGEENAIRSEIERQLRAVEDVPW